jgi:hypothetical protein
MCFKINVPKIGSKMVAKNNSFGLKTKLQTPSCPAPPFCNVFLGKLFWYILGLCLPVWRLWFLEKKV